MKAPMVDRRGFVSAGITAFYTAMTNSLRSLDGQEVTTESLGKQLSSPLSGPGVGAELPESPAASSDAISQSLFPGFQSRDLKTSGATIRVLTKGTGWPLLLLHGHPETHVTWHKIATALADRYSVVLTDLRGYGDSSKPGYSADNRNYSFREMAQDQIEVMGQLGYKRFFVAGHDRGGRVAHRLCLDHPDSVEKVSLLDIAPTLTMYNDTNKEFATKYVWWFLQIQPATMPEHLISLDPVYYLRDHLAVQGKTPGAVTPEAMAEYIRCYSCRGTIRAVCEDYRAAAGIDLDMDRASDAAGQKIQAPILALWGAQGTVGKLWNVVETWKAKAAGSVKGQALPCGHLLPEEQPQAVLDAFQKFF